MTPDELPGALEAIAGRALAAATPAVNAMASTYKDHLTRITLRETQHPPHTHTTAPRGGPPAYMTGRLAASVRRTPGTGGPVSTATVAPHTIYAAIQETGGPIDPERVRYLRWASDGWVHFARHVDLPERPYMQIAQDATVRDGSLHRAGERAFGATVWGA